MANDFALPISERDGLKVEKTWTDNEVFNFGRGVIKGGIEDPVNGLAQMTGYLSGKKIPELHLVDEQKALNTTGGALGNIVGKAADFAALALATKNIAQPSSLTGSVIRGGTLGAIYGGVLTPSKADSESFLLDRVKNAATNFATFSTMAYAGAKLDATGLFSVPEARTLLGSASYGALTGAAGGVVYSEADAILNKGRILPTGKDFVDNIGSWATFGAVMGGVNWGYYRHTEKIVEAKTTAGSDGSRADMKVQLDSNGRPVYVSQHLEVGDGRNHHWSSSLKTNGSWSDKGQGEFRTPSLQQVKIEGNKIITLDDLGNHRYYATGQPFDSDRLRAKVLLAEHEKAGAPTGYDGIYGGRKAYEHVRITKRGWIEYDWTGKGEPPTVVHTDLGLGYRKYDADGRLLTIRPEWTPRDHGKGGYGDFRQNADGSLNKLAVANPPKDGKGPTSYYLNQTQPGVYEMRQNESLYKVEGQFRLNKPATPNGVEQLEFTSKTGAKTVMPASELTKIAQIIEQNTKLEPGATGFSFVRMDDKAGTARLFLSKNSSMLVNGVKQAPGTEIQIKPGDQLTTTVRLGIVDKTFNFDWVNNAFGNSIGKYPALPNAVFDLMTR